MFTPICQGQTFVLYAFAWSEKTQALLEECQYDLTAVFITLIKQGKKPLETDSNFLIMRLIVLDGEFWIESFDHSFQGDPWNLSPVNEEDMKILIQTEEDQPSSNQSRVIAGYHKMVEIMREYNQGRREIL